MRHKDWCAVWGKSKKSTILPLAPSAWLLMGNHGITGKRQRGSGLAFCCVDLNFEASEMKYGYSILCLIGFDGWE
jgi:hypothetical protein